MSEREVVIGIALDDACLTLEQVAVACAVDARWLVARIEAGLLAPMAGPASDWRFEAAAITRARRMREIERTFDAVPELAALVADLLEEMDALRAQAGRRGP